MIEVLRSSAHAHPRWRNCGGGHRSLQIEEILQRGGVGWTDQLSDHRAGRRQLLIAALRLRFTAPAIPLGHDRGLVRYLANDYLRHRAHFRRHIDARVFLVEEGVDYARLRAAREAGIGIISVPHNLEVWQQSPPRDFYSGEGMPGCLHREATFLGLSDVVFCISREEQWFLANYGVQTDFLPYHPPETTLSTLTRIRTRRSTQRPANEFLAFANANNTKNREGLIALAKIVSEMPSSPDVRLHVGGFETAGLQSLFPADRCVFHGEVGNDTLESLMTRCKAAVVCQLSGVGALTRIPELLCAGIPVLATPHAARSQYYRDGVHLFHSPSELSELSRAELPVPEMPRPDAQAEARLVEWVRRLDSRGRRTEATR